MPSCPLDVSGGGAQRLSEQPSARPVRNCAKWQLSLSLSEMLGPSQIDVKRVLVRMRKRRQLLQCERDVMR